MGGENCGTDDCGTLEPVDPNFPDDVNKLPDPPAESGDEAGQPPDAAGAHHAHGFTEGYSRGWRDAVDKYEDDETTSEMELTFSTADLILLGVAFIALLIPLGFLASRTERPRWKPPWS